MGWGAKRWIGPRNPVRKESACACRGEQRGERQGWGWERRGRERRGPGGGRRRCLWGGPKNNPRSGERGSVASAAPGCPTCPQGEREVPGRPPWERSRCRIPAAAAVAARGPRWGHGDVLAGGTERCPWPTPAPLRARGRGRASPRGDPWAALHPGGGNRLPPAAPWQCLASSREPLSSRRTLPSPRQSDAGAGGMAEHVKVIPTASLQPIPTPSSATATSRLRRRPLGAGGRRREGPLPAQGLGLP